MSKQMAFDILTFAFKNLDLDPKFHIYFWGGEPTLNFEVMKAVMTKYPQFLYHTNTNGATINNEMYDFFMKNKNFSLTWSFGNAYEKYGSVQDKVKNEFWAHKLIEDNRNNNINFMVVKYDKFSEDFDWIFNNVTRNLTMDIATRYEHKDEDLEILAQQYFDLLLRYKDQPDVYHGMNPAIHSNLYYKEYGLKSQVREFHYCRSGLERLFIDMNGGIWQCDNMYICQHNQLGNIKDGIDYSKLELALKIDEEREKYLGKYCENCELYKQCPRNKCLGLNLEYTGDMFRPEPSFCKMCKVLFKVTQKYIELQKREGVLCQTL
jgi:radical SAM protein with 4Fe4S-binding SPASM domain